ncbi:MAG: SEL1-like repeat protein [Alphaproteobacteria bacterium]|nr:SEL1-like repeat protein [Alphaproteobacteria bacterium]
MKNRVLAALSLSFERQTPGGELMSMKPGIPWSVKGVEPELREIAKTAARRSGMTLGEWLNSAINEQAEGHVPDAVAEAPTDKVIRGRISTHPIERAATRLEDIAEQLSRLAQRETDTSPRYVSPQPEENGAFAKILSRVESNERQTVEAFSAVNERLALLGRQFTKFQAPVVQTKPEEAPGFQALEKAVRNIVEHLEVSEKRTRDNLKSLQDRIGDMTARANSTTNEQVLRQAPAFSQLENRLAELAHRVEQSQKQPISSLPELLRQELDGLASRIDTVRESSEALAQKAQTQAVQTAQAELHTIEDRILGLLREAQTSFVANSTSPSEIQRFRNEIEKLNARIDESSKGVASDRDVTALRVAVEQLSTRVAQGNDDRPLAEMDRRILDITRKLEQTQAQTRDMPQLGELERRMAELDHRLDQALSTQNAAAQSDELVQHLAVVNDRLSKTEHQLSHLETIERAIAQLYDSVEQSRGWTKEVAEEAASRMGQHILSQQNQAPASLAGTPEIMALEDGLKAVREASQNADSRNQETLEAVHETLEQIVAKLTELETAAIGQRVAQAASPIVAGSTTVAQPVADPFQFTGMAEAPAPFSVAPAVDELNTHPEPENAFVASAGDPFAEAAPAAAGNPFDAIIKSAHTAEGTQAAAPADDFIAAARRAAQAAGASKSSLSGVIPGGIKGDAAGGKRLLNFKVPFSKKAKSTAIPNLAGDMKVPPPIRPANNNLAGNRRTLILSGILALGLFAFFVTKNIMAPAPVAQTPVTAEPVQTEQTQTAPTQPETAPAAPAPLDNGSATAAPQVAPVVSPKPGVTPAPLEPAAGVTEQHGEVVPPEPDTILTGSLPAAVAAKAATPAAIDVAIGNDKLRTAATSGDANAQFVIASRYLNGENVVADPVKAAYWYGRAAATGLAPAQYRIATLYERGTGVEKNMQAALSWYERAAALGNVKAMHNAAVISASTDAGAADYVKAFKWFSLAANHGLKDSQFNLAVLVERGMGTKIDLAEALFWYDQAAAQGDVDARTHATAMAKSMPPELVNSVERRLKTWKPEPAPDAANVVTADNANWLAPGLAPRQSAAATQAPASAPLPQNIVGKAQTLLDKLGYNVGELDGKAGGRTTNAIRLFQLQQGLKVTGQITPDLIAAMESKAS